jgi:phenylalanyl-tRNA synthetase beta chain
MKVTYNWLKDFVEIKISPQALAEKLTMAGLEVTSLEKEAGDFIFEIEVTSNRPDWLSVVGIAREVAAITNKKLFRQPVSPSARQPVRYVDRKTARQEDQLTIEIQDKKDCPLYTAKIIQDVKVGPSPEWLKIRLELLGCRSANNIVDITNYILFEQGEPLHAFDLDKLKGNSIFVRRAKPGEKITTIDAEQRMLNPDILVIADEERPVAVAGVMGSKDTEVTEATKNILLEAAVFNPIIVRRGRRNLGIQSESSYRFERGVNLEIVDNASWQAAELIQDFAGGSCVFAKSSGATKTKRKSIVLGLSAVNKILGINIPASKIKKILSSLEFKTNPVRNTKSSRKKLKISNGAKIKTKEHFAVEIPAHRPDVTSEIDLIEEIARIYGYENVPQTLPSVEPQVSVGEARDLVSLIKNILVGLGLNEVITYSLMDKDLLRDFGIDQGPEVIEILNPLSKEQEILRPGLIPSLAACVAYNLNQKQDYINIFEVTKVFSQSKASTHEELRLGIALCGIKSLLLEQGLIKDPVGLLHLKGISEVLFARLGIRDYAFKAEGNGSIISVYAGGEKIGLMAKLEKSVLDKLDIKNKDVFALELSLDRLLFFMVQESIKHFPIPLRKSLKVIAEGDFLVNLNKKFSHLPIYPGISRDISLILKEEISVGDILKAIKEEGQPLLKQAAVVDYYKGKQIPPGFKGLTLSCFYRSDERTLTEAEINPVHSLICKILADRFGAQIR